jgi:hypothetical protein
LLLLLAAACHWVRLHQAALLLLLVVLPVVRVQQVWVGRLA